MKIIIVNIVVKPEFREDFIKETQFAQHKSMEEPGCFQYQLCENVDDKNKFVLIEGYTDEAAIESHKATPHFQQWRTNVWDWMAENRISYMYNEK